MNNLRILLMASVAIIIATSCTVEHTIDYNKDMSGTNSIIIDYGEIMEQMGDMMGDSSGLGDELDMTDGLGDLEDSFRDIDGVSNIGMINESEDKRMGFTFDFKDTKALNSAMSNYVEGESSGKKKKGPKSYKAKKKALIINFADQDLGSMTEGLGDPSMAAMLGMFDYDLTINLPVPVKSVNNRLYNLSEDRKSLNAVVNLEDMTNGSEDLSAKIKW